MKKYILISALTTLMIAVALTVAGSSYAANSNSSAKKTFTDTQAEIQDSIKNNDFSTWKSLMEQKSQSRFSQTVTQENFNKIAEQHKIRDAVQTAIKNADYSSWKTAVANANNGTEMLKTIDTEAKFKTYAEAQKLIEDGQAKIKQGRDKMDELGLKGGMMGDKGFNRKGGMRGGFGMMKGKIK